MEILLLGPIEIIAGGRTFDVGPAKQQSVLAALLIEAPGPVSIERLIDRVWDNPPPAEARNVVYAHISRIRRLLDSVDDGDPVRLVRRAGGYTVDVELDRVDLHRMRRLIDRARVSECDEHRQSALLGQALGLWRSEPLAGLNGTWMAAVRQQLLLQRIDAALRWADIEVRRGDAVAAIDMLRPLVTDNPLHEELAVGLMQALHATGRTVEALDCYAAIRERMADELGLDLGVRIRQAHRVILRGAYAQRGPTPPPRDGLPPAMAIRPRQMPAPPWAMVGRTAELETITKALTTRPRPDGRAAVVAIHGPAGVGKSTLAIAAGHAVARRFPDGQLYADLQGATTGLQPLAPIDALGRFLRALGVPSRDVPADAGEAAALYRSLLSQREVLIIADNAGSVDQVLPLVPAASGCAMMVTSRVVLSMLDHSMRVGLQLLSAADAEGMLVMIVGGSRGVEEQPAIAEVARACGYLPLALRAAGARLVSRPDWTFADLARRLCDERRTLVELDSMDTSLRASLQLSWRELRAKDNPVDDLAASVFLALGVVRLPRVKPGPVAAMTDCTPELAETALDRLVEVRLLEQDAGGYLMHDLMRLYAAELGARESEAARHRPLLAALQWYLAAALQVCALMRGSHAPLVARRPELRHPPTLADPLDAGAWLDSERSNLVAVVRQGAALSPASGRLTADLVLALYPALLLRGHDHEWEELCSSVIDAADRIGDHKTLALVREVRRHCHRHGLDSAADCALAVQRSPDCRSGDASILEPAGTVRPMHQTDHRDRDVDPSRG